MIRFSRRQRPWIKRLLPVSMLIFLGMLWGGVPSISKYVIQHGVNPLSYSFWVLVTATSVLLIINVALGRGLPPRHLTFYVICGLTGNAIPTTIMYFAVSQIPAGLMALLLTVAPVFTYVFGMGLNAEKHHPLKTIGLLFALFGIVLIVLPDSVAEMKAPVWAIFLALATPALYASNIVYTFLKRPSNLHVLDLSFGMLLVSTVTLFIFATSFSSINPIWQLDPILTTLILYHGALTAIAFCLFYILVKMSGALFSSQVTYPVTIFGILFGAYIHSEVLPLWVWVATAVMFTGIALVQKARRLTHED